MKSTRIDLRRVLRYRDADDPCPLQRHYSHPEHDLVADIDIVLAHKRQLAAITDTETDRPAVRVFTASPSRILTGGFVEQPAGVRRVDVKGAWVYLLGLDVLDSRRLAASENRDQSRPPPSDLKGQPQGALLNGRLGTDASSKSSPASFMA